MKMSKRLRRYFFAGLAVTLPIVITCYILFIFFRFADNLLGKYINKFLKDVLGYGIPGIGLVIGILFVLFVGIITTHFIGKRLIPLLERWFSRLPFVSLIYPSAKQMVNVLFSKENLPFKKVVMIEYPRKGLYSIGFVTNEGIEEIKAKTSKDMLTVFLASTPNPLTGYFVLVPKEEVIFLDMNVEEAIKLLVSGGIIYPQRTAK
ncbi:MAG: DUF502 domain-containing protein [Candidatus Omnitrophota bacterium]